ncbi:hypothetical protein E5288_WYG020189 [Bos mutus]|uniref:Uncharacterized protein n=1 Tax=Bos mutus TaxID=72004 RepID=A0A6B0S414_9CETA|nr:hypothetical protein [Bos mutus]
MVVAAAAPRPRTRVACLSIVSAACGALRVCSTTACRMPWATSRTHAPASRATRAPPRAGPLWLPSRSRCPASAATRPCVHATGSRRDAAAPAVEVATKRLRGENGLMGPVAGPRTPN